MNTLHARFGARACSGPVTGHLSQTSKIAFNGFICSTKQKGLGTNLVARNAHEWADFFAQNRWRPFKNSSAYVITGVSKQVIVQKWHSKRD